LKLIEVGIAAYSRACHNATFHHKIFLKARLSKEIQKQSECLCGPDWILLAVLLFLTMQSVTNLSANVFIG
jgi:hypothetical protein